MARVSVAFATILCILVSILERTFCFNFETRLPVIKEGPENSYFGFSVAEHILSTVAPSAPFSESVILVGAPIYQTNIQAVKPGGVFRCPFSSNYSDCSLLELDSDGDVGDSEGTAIKDNQWLGVSVVSQGPGGPVAACAHRYKAQPASIEEIQGLGKCYFLTGDLEKDIFTGNGYIPCTGRTRPDNYDGNLYKYCQAGTDVAVSRLYMYSDPSSQFSEYIMGIPGTDNWLGGIATSNTPDLRSRNLITPLDYINNGVSFNSYLGFSVASAKLMDGNVQTYVAGAPRADSMGAVLILKSQADHDPIFVDRIDAEKPSSSFGYDVTAADLTGDGYDELIVGAPQFFVRKPGGRGDGGRVYIYHNEAHDGTFTNVEPIKLTGPQDSLFGQVVANLRDINLDGREDIAVGAPYENDGQGAVYIYLGHATYMISQPAAQKIRPIDLPMGLNGYPFPNASFGYSIAGGIDLDGNGFPEIAIGAYEVQQITVLRGRPIINIEQETSLSTTTLDHNTTNCEYSGKQSLCFQIRLCLSYFCNAPVFDDQITINFDIEAEELRRNIDLSSRVVFEESGIYALRGQNLTLQPQSLEEEACSPNFNVVIKPPLKDIFRPIPLKLTYYIPEVEAVMPQPGDPLPSLTPFPILNNNIEPVIEVEVAFVKECAKDDNKCITDLIVLASVQLPGDPIPLLKVGEQPEVVLSVSIENAEEDAYDAKLVITYPVFLHYINIEEASSAITANCKKTPREEGANTTSIVCELGNPYPMHASDSFIVRYDAQTVPPDAEEFVISLSAFSTNDEESNPEDNDVVITIEVESITDILISGKGPEQMYFSGVVRGESAMENFEDIGLAVDQKWTIYNEGPGSVNTGMVTIDFPIEVENGKWLLYLTEMPYVEDDKGVCNVTPAVYVNELGLKPRNQPASYNPVAPVTTETLQLRKRREAAPEPAKSTQELTAGKDIILNCETGSAVCVTIRCDLSLLTAEPENNEVKIVIRSRLWNSTFLEDYLNAKSVKIITEGSIEIESAPYITQKRTDNDRFKLSMTVTPDIKTLPPSKPLQWWVIALAVIGGLILLILLILLLWKCGFFERKTGYKYATVTQQQAAGKAKTDKTGYYDDMYYS